MKVPIPIVDVLDAQSNLPRFVEAVESGREAEVIIARNGRPVARLVPVAGMPAGQRIGVAAGKFMIPESIDNENGSVAALFGLPSE